MLVRFRPNLFVACSVAFLLLLPLSARTEIVSIHAKSGEIGHGWLFGSAGVKSGECWIVAPAHVVVSPETRELQAFTYTDRNGVSRESETPLPGAPSEKATVADKEAGDLSFARVKNGRKDMSCLSRLGVPTFVYQNLMTSSATLTATSLLMTSFGEFDVSITRGAVDALGGSVLNFRPVAAEDSRFLQKGLSGATIVTHRSGDVVPFAMILRVPSNQESMRGLRFDYIRQRFEAIERAARGVSTPDTPEGKGPIYKILGFSANAGIGAAGPSILSSHDGCWRPSAREGNNQIELQIEVSDPLLRVQTIELVQTANCTAGRFSFYVEQRTRPTDEWVFVGKCSSSVQRQPCRIGLQAPREFRLRFDAREPIAMSGLLLR